MFAQATPGYAKDVRVGVIDIQVAVTGTKEWKKEFSLFKTKFEKEKVLNQLFEQEINTPYDLENDVMLRASYIELDNGEKPHGVLFYNMHHIAFDGWSMDIFHREFFALYYANISGLKNPSLLR